MADLEWRCLRGAFCLLAMISCAIAQESSPPPAIPELSATPSLSESSPPPEAPPVPSAPPTATATPTTSPARSVRISFLPPPLEGKVSLGIYDSRGELVRVLHKEAAFSEFTIGADALITKWDGKDDAGKDRPAGKYRARGFLVGSLKVETLGPTETPPANADSTGTIQIKLMPNELSKGGASNVDLTVGFDGKKVWLRTADGLPLFSTDSNAIAPRVRIRKNGDKAVDIFLDEADRTTQIRISNLDMMMAFDCGEIELK